MEIGDAPLPKRGRKRAFREAGVARGRYCPDVDQKGNAGSGELDEKLVNRLPLITDREQLQSNSSSRKLFLRLLYGSWWP